MTAIITDQFRFSNINTIEKRLDTGVDNFYLGIGRSEPWTDEVTPPVPNIDIEDQLEARHNLHSMKKVSNIVRVVPRYNWTSGSTYYAYSDSDPNLHTKAFYVLNRNNFNVYMCLKAGAGVSTVEPLGVDDGGSGLAADKGSVTPSEGADGYVWKYMYTISAADSDKYLTTDFMPAFRDDNVRDNAVQGTIHSLEITEGGAGYSSAPTVSIEGDGTGATATVSLTGGVVTGFTMTNVGSGYTYAKVSLTGGSPSTPAEMRPVVSPSSVGRGIHAIAVTSGGTSYANGSVDITITGDGYEATATGTVTGGVLQDSIVITDGGHDYTQAVATINANTAGDEAILSVQFTDRQGGFGFNSLEELLSKYLMFSVILEGDEDPAEGFQGDFITANEYRQLVLIKNPLTNATNPTLFTETTGKCLKYLTVASGGTWNLDDTITGGSSGAVAVIDYYDSTTERLYYHQNETTGFIAFVDGETLTGVGVSTGNVDSDAGSANGLAEVDKYSGTLSYLENRVAVSRAPDQTEKIFLVVQL